jgi:hypothetical protein
MEKSKEHTNHYWIRHKDGYLFCGVCKKKQDSSTKNISKND